MKRHMLRFAFVLGMVFLSACSSNVPTENTDNDTHEQASVTAENANSIEKNTIDPNNEQAENSIETDDNEGESLNDDINQSDNDTSQNETNTSIEQTDSNMDAAVILEKSFEAMSEVTSLSMESVIDVHEEMGGDIFEEERTFNTVM